MAAVAEQPAVTRQDQAAVITRGYEVLGRARERAWRTGGGCVVFAMAVLNLALKDAAAARGGGGAALALSDAEGVTRHLIAVIRRVCGGDEADYVGGDE